MMQKRIRKNVMNMCMITSERNKMYVILHLYRGVFGYRGFSFHMDECVFVPGLLI